MKDLMTDLYNTIRSVFIALLAVGLMTSYAQKAYGLPGEVLNYRHIDNAVLGGALGDNDWFGFETAYLGNLGSGSPTSNAIAVGAMLGGDNDWGAVWILFLGNAGNVVAQQEISNGVGGIPSGVVTGRRFGDGLTSLGDLDGDNIVDLAVGASHPGGGAGEVWILFLNSDGTVKQYQKIASGSGGFPVAS